VIAALHSSVQARWSAMDRGAQGALLGISGQGLITHGWTLGDVTALVPLDYSRIVYSAVLGFFIFGELPGLWSFAGMAIIVASSLYLVLTERRR
jgi:drug/metabolite transporter (DMT)-like permease